jgi:hypothetical protein
MDAVHRPPPSDIVNIRPCEPSRSDAGHAGLLAPEIRSDVTARTRAGAVHHGAIPAPEQDELCTSMGGLMKGTPILLENMASELETGLATQHNMGVGLGILAIVGVAVAWNIALVLFHNLMARLLS